MSCLLLLHLNENGSKPTTNGVPWFPEEGCTGDARAEDAHSLLVLEGLVSTQLKEQSLV